MSKLQQKDIFCNNILNQIEKGNIIEGQLYVVKDKVLKNYVIDGNNTYETTIIPRVITAQILWMAHDNLSHNGTHRTLCKMPHKIQTKSLMSLWSIVIDNNICAVISFYVL